MTTTRKIPVGTQHFALVDAEDYDLVAPHRWYAFNRQRNRTVYAYRFIGPNGEPAGPGTGVKGHSWQYMHQLITGFSQTDHKNNNGLDNRRENLRETTAAGNRRNTAKQRGSYTSRFKGVSRKRKKWKAGIQVDKKQIWLGVFDTEVEAAKAYNEAALRYFGEFAYINQLEGTTTK